MKVSGDNRRLILVLFGLGVIPILWLVTNNPENLWAAIVYFAMGILGLIVYWRGKII